MGYFSRAFETKRFLPGENIVFDAGRRRSRGVVVSVEEYFGAMPQLGTPSYRKIVQRGVDRGITHCVHINGRYSVLSSEFLHKEDVQS